MHSLIVFLVLFVIGFSWIIAKSGLSELILHKLKNTPKTFEVKEESEDEKW